MNYSAEVITNAKRIMISWFIVASIFFTLGCGTAYAVTTNFMTSKQPQQEFITYGSYDDRIFTEEVSLDWGTGDLDFTPLSVDMPEEQQEFLYYLCAGYNIDFPLVMAIIQQESSYDPDTISVTGDYGLMQINQVNHDELTQILGVTDFFDPYENMRAGCFILRKLFEKYEDVNMVLMAYNLGETAASKLWSNGVYSTRYTDMVQSVQRRFNDELGR